MILEIIACNDYSLANILSIVKRIILLIQIIVPILLIISGTLSLIKSMQNPDEKDNHKKIINSFLAAAVVFFIPLLINLVFQMIGEKTSLSSCWVNANDVLDSTSPDYYETSEVEKKPIILNPDDYESGGINLNYNNAIEVSNDALKNASHSDPSIVITGEDGNVLAQRKPLLRREGASTTKVFAGYAAVMLLDPEKDVITGTQFAVNAVGKWNGAPIGVGNKFSVTKAATYNFPGSSNSTATDIAVAIGKKHYNCSSDEDCFNKGMKKINEFYSDMNLTDTHLGNTSGLNGTPRGHMRFYPNGLPKDGCKDGHTANDLAIVTIQAMQNEYFASGIKGRNNDGLFFIKSGTGYQCHGIWGFNNKGKRYYISQLGINCNAGDNKYQVVKDIYHWAVNNIIK